MYITIDQGNSRVKYMAWAEDKPVALSRGERVTAGAVVALADGVRIDGMILCSVTDNDPMAIEELSRLTDRLILLSSFTPMPVEIGYSTPLTLGPDRIAAAAGAVAVTGHGGVAVVDAGTAITVDYVDEKCVFRGGNIAPGLRMQLRSLHELTARLPLVDVRPDAGDVPLLGTDTISAIRSGVVGALAGHVEHVVAGLPGDTQVVITGGDASLIADAVSFKAIVDPMLTSRGLYEILKYNL